MGFSFAYNSPVAPLLFLRARNTLLLTITATLIAWGIALPLGIWSAERFGRLPDRLLSWVTAALLVIPDLALALGFLVFAVRTGQFPTGGMTSLDFQSLPPIGKLRDLALHMTLPVAALVLSAMPLLVRHVRAAVAEVLDAPFMLAARGHGIPRRTLLYRYALRAAANPLISLFGFSIGALLSGSLLVEVVMSWPGLGPLLLESILSRDLYVVIGGVLFSTFFLVSGNFVADIFLYWPIRESHRKRRPMRTRQPFAKWLLILGALHAIVVAQVSSRRTIPSNRIARIHTCRQCRFIWWTHRASSPAPVCLCLKLREGAFDRYEQDTSQPVPMEFFKSGAAYRLLGLLPSRIHLFGSEDTRICLLGTDVYGRDQFSRLLYGGQISLLAGILGAGCTLSIGLCVGAAAGYFGGWKDDALMRVAELFLALPWLYLLFALAHFSLCP